LFLASKKAIVDDVHKKILHFPLNFRTWSSEKPVWASALGTRCILHLPGEKHLSVGLGRWVIGLEEEGLEGEGGLFPTRESWMS
jgi:hypothetical protein